MNDAILIRCGKCGGKRRWIFLDINTKHEAKRWMWKAAIRGHLIETGERSTTEQRHPACQCPKDATNGDR